MRHLIDITDFSVEEITGILDLADQMIANPADWRDCLRGRILATLFFEPSTRTRLSFESAMLSLGGSVLGFASADSSSTAKGETLKAEAKCIKAGRTTCLYGVDVYDELGTHVAYVTVSGFTVK